MTWCSLASRLLAYSVRRCAPACAHSLLPVHIPHPLPTLLPIDNPPLPCPPTTRSTIMCIPKTSPLDLHALKCPSCKLNKLNKCTHYRATCSNQANHRSYNKIPNFASRRAPSRLTRSASASASSPFPRRLFQDRPTDLLRLWLLQGLHSLSAH